MTSKQAKAMYIIGRYLIKYDKLPTSTKPKRPKLNQPIKRGHVFKRTVNRHQLAKAVHAMYLRKQGKYKLSINKICKRFKISKPSLYRGFNKKYKNK